MRNGLPHKYWPNRLRVDGTDVELSFSWGEKQHLSWSADGERVLLVPALVDWDCFAAQLAIDADARATERIDLQKLGRIDTIWGSEKAAWLRILEVQRG